jgi:hypothetical protein
MGKLKNAITTAAGNLNPRLVTPAAKPATHYKLIGIQDNEAILRCSPSVSRRLTAVYGDGVVDLYSSSLDSEDARLDKRVRRHILANLPATLVGDVWDRVTLQPNAKGVWYVRLLSL